MRYDLELNNAGERLQIRSRTVYSRLLPRFVAKPVDYNVSLSPLTGLNCDMENTPRTDMRILTRLDTVHIFARPRIDNIEFVNRSFKLEYNHNDVIKDESLIGLYTFFYRDVYTM